MPSAGPIQERDADRTVISYGIQTAAARLIEAATRERAIALSRETLAQLQRLSRCDHEYRIVDPFVVISDTIETELYRLHLKEAVPVSALLVARHLRLSYRVELMPGAFTTPKSYADVGRVKPFHGNATEHAQPFGLEATVQAALSAREDAGVFARIALYMANVGHLDPAEAADPAFLDEHTPAMGKVLANARALKDERPVLGKKDNGTRQGQL
jgi:hypothetical protein